MRALRWGGIAWAHRDDAVLTEGHSVAPVAWVAPGVGISTSKYSVTLTGVFGYSHDVQHVSDFAGMYGEVQVGFTTSKPILWMNHFSGSYLWGDNGVTIGMFNFGWDLTTRGKPDASVFYYAGVTIGVEEALWEN